MHIKNKKREDLQTKNKERKKKKNQFPFIFFNQATFFPKNDPSVAALEMGANAMGEELLGLWPRGQRLNDVTQTVIWRIGDLSALETLPQCCLLQCVPWWQLQHLQSVCMTVASTTLDSEEVNTADSAMEVDGAHCAWMEDASLPVVCTGFLWGERS